MLDFIKKQLESYSGDQDMKYNYLREILQMIILKKLDESGGFQSIAFLGGTALRILHDLKRFSEDLYFSLIQKTDFDFTKLMKKIERELKLESFDVEFKIKDKYPVPYARIKFKTILHELDLSYHEDQVIFINLDVDLNPPQGAILDFTMVNRFFMVGISHYDLPSLFSGKLHAFLQREYTKGRDYYDYLWYTSKKISPNFTLLNNALEQSTQHNPNLGPEELKEQLREKFESTDFDHVRSDVLPFLELPAEARFFNQDTFLATLENFS